MFRRLAEPLPLSEASMLALCPALNTPVLNVKFLPVGPARAAVVVFAEEYGGIGIAIGLRSNEGGQVVVLVNPEPIDAGVPIEVALETGLSTAEPMGFLFDEDLVGNIPGGQGRSQAMELWGDLMGELESFDPAEADPNQGGAGSDSTQPETAVEDREDLLLDDLGPTESLPPKQSLLSKFRGLPPMSSATADGEVSDPESSRSSALGRIPIVQVRKGEQKRISYLARLLSSF